jgi:alanyl-tRNA synthetase
VQVDAKGFEAEMLTQRRRSKDSAKSVELEVGGVLAGLGSQLASTAFSGYTKLDGRGCVVALLRGGDSVTSVGQGKPHLECAHHDRAHLVSQWSSDMTRSSTEDLVRRV